MNTNRLKKFAQQARLKLLDQVNSRMELVLNTDSAELREKANAVRQLKEAIADSSKEQVIDKVAYTWFNRFMALRFMDVNGYQPLKLQVVSPKEGFTLPELLEDAIKGQVPEELPVKKQHIFDLLDGKIPSSNPQNEIYKELLIAACNHLHSVFPFLFEKINDYTELLLPDDLTSEFSILHDFLEGMQKEDCKEVEVIGWLYQFYISEKKDEVFASKGKVKKEEIPAATQLFTPRWIVEYMVQNTVGKLWMQNNPNSSLREHMPYFIESPSVTAEDYLKINSVEEITLLDQACGSGHILVYGFELLSKIYEEEGYTPGEIPQLIIEKNLYGFEIDERAAQLAGFALMMKAREYHRRVFRKEIVPNILCFEDVVFSQQELMQVLVKTYLDKSREFQNDLKLLENATNFGSLIIPESSPEFFQKAKGQIEDSLKRADVFEQEQLERLNIAIRQLYLLSRKYHCIVDNPPYMGGRKMKDELKVWLKSNFIQGYQDLFSCFVIRSQKQLFPLGLSAMVTLQGWLFVNTFENFRKWLLKNVSFQSLVQIGGNSFPSLNSQVARAVTFTFLNKKNIGENTVCFDLDNVPKSHNVDKQELFNLYLINQTFTERSFKRFNEVNTYTFLHSIPEDLLNVFVESIPFFELAKPKQGLATGCNEKFVKFWWEVEYKKSYWGNISDPKWYPYNKGGDFRKWYGNNENIINWENNGYEIKNFKNSAGRQRSAVRNEGFYFKPGITYSLIGNSDFCARAYGEGYLFDVGGSGFFPVDADRNFLLGLVNSKVGSYLLSRLNPTVNFQVGDIGNIPIPPGTNSIDEINRLVNENILLSKEEWALFEENPEFRKSESLLKSKEKVFETVIEEVILQRTNNVNSLFNNETLIDDFFSQLYRLNPEVLNKTKKLSLFGTIRTKQEIRIYDFINIWKEKIIIDFLSYAVGCMFGRYSLDKEGLILANQGETLEDYLEKVEKDQIELTYLPDDDNIMPILDDEWFEDDIVNRFYDFLKASFGKENFDKNLAFVEECLGRDVRSYFVQDFYKDHIKRYKKRPIYWMFSSPKGNFNVLIYLHRYTQDTLNNILNGYLLEYKEKIKARMEHLDHIIETGSSTEQTKAGKEKNKLKLILLELQEYEREILYPLATQRISIDLDDGVLVNYNKFGKAIKEVKGLNDAKTKKKVKGFDWIETETII